MYKRTKMVWLLVLVVAVGSLLASCATATAVPPNATAEQLEQVNAKNLEAVARNSSVTLGIQLTSIALSILSVLIYL